MTDETKSVWSDIWGWLKWAWGLNAEFIDWLGADAVAVLWPASLLAVWWLL